MTPPEIMRLFLYTTLFAMVLLAVSFLKRPPYFRQRIYSMGAISIAPTRFGSLFSHLISSRPPIDFPHIFRV